MKLNADDKKKDPPKIDIAFFYSDPLVDKKDSWTPNAVSAPNLQFDEEY